MLQQIAKVLQQIKAEQWKTTIDLLCLNREEGHVEAGQIIRFIHGKSIVVFCLRVARLLQSAVAIGIAATKTKTKP